MSLAESQPSFALFYRLNRIMKENLNISAKDIIFKIINYGTKDYRKIASLRENILRKPLGQSFTPEELSSDKDYIHIAGFLKDELCATAMLVLEEEKLRMKRVAIKTEYQNRGLGSRLVEYCEFYAQQHGFEEIFCHARETAIPFYLKNHYLPPGEFFDENTTPPQKMRKMILKIR